MGKSKATWALVLAAGSGTRLASLTRDEQGRSVPKQFCSLTGRQALVDDAVRRARYVAPRERICIVVAEQHHDYWSKALVTFGASNVVVQPRNCGTAIGILLAVLHIVNRDPLARIVFLPADHFVRDEGLLGESLCEAAALTTGDSRGVVLIGIEPEGVDPDLGYIVPGATGSDGARRVERFVEKPDASRARELLTLGAVWNSFIFATAGAALLDEMRQRFPHIVTEMLRALARDARLSATQSALREVYQTLPIVDFSSAVLQGMEPTLRLVTAAACGWTDLGTPGRVAGALQSLERGPAGTEQHMPPIVPGVVNLAVQSRRMALIA